MSPSTIHSVMTHSGNSFWETPNIGKMFGWERRLQIMISGNKRCHESLRAENHKITSCEPAQFLTDYRLCMRGRPLCTHDYRRGVLSKHRRTDRKRMRCRPPLRYCLRVCKNVA